MHESKPNRDPDAKTPTRQAAGVLKQKHAPAVRHVSVSHNCVYIG